MKQQRLEYRSGIEKIAFDEVMSLGLLEDENHLLLDGGGTNHANKEQSISLFFANQLNPSSIETAENQDLEMIEKLERTKQPEEKQPSSSLGIFSS